ncbi:MAG: TetR/AcrR family transcriptional regulator C-terminal domain-containing protein [Eubacteriales bacterium]|nr:TetR/AcrR family transcriptional regulator C-terminal domain-containing protein [Eubacteriales bacterium]
MADSNITKRALADAMKKLLEEKSFSKVSVADICEECGMNRKSFYYHFKDKYDLMNWIFDTEFIQVIQKRDDWEIWDLLKALCDFFYKNWSFYRKALAVTGQNSFSEHFHELLYNSLRANLRQRTGLEKVNEFQAMFFADAFVMAVRRWLLGESGMKPEEFLDQLKLCTQCVTV